VSSARQAKTDGSNDAAFHQYSTPQPCITLQLYPADAKVVAVAAGMQHSLALTAGGEVYSWGNAANGRLGHGSAAKRKLFGASIEFKPRLIRAFEALRVAQVTASVWKL
jgi:alpha-tubulin suppressor-like RCC1 family protein